MPWTTLDPIRIVIAGPPKALERNRHRIVNKRDGSRFVSNYPAPESAKEQSTIRKEAWVVMGNKPPLDCPIDLRVVAYMPIAASWSKKKRAAALADQIRPSGKPDADNILKLLSDALKEIIWRDDALVTECVIWKRYSDRPRLLIEVRALVWRAGLLE